MKPTTIHLALKVGPPMVEVCKLDESRRSQFVDGGIHS